MEKYTEMIEGIYKFIGILREISEKISKSKENNIDIPIHFQEALYLSRSMTRIDLIINKSRNCMNTLYQARRDFGTISAFELLSKQKKLEWLNKSTNTELIFSFFPIRYWLENWILS